MKRSTPLFFQCCLFCILECTIQIIPVSIKAQQPYVEVTAGPSRSLPADYWGQNAANIIQIRSLTDTYLRSKIPLLHPGTIRHVASSQANWWDWRSGWLLQQKDLPAGYTLRDDWAVLDPEQDKISDLKFLADTTGASILFAPNVLTSRLDYQVAALFEFADQNLRVPYVEMGSEFYLDNPSANLRFPTAVQYADTASKWITGFKSLFPNLKISCIGATEQGNSPRRNTWTQMVIDNAQGYDALSVKIFLPTGLNLPDSIIPKSALPDLFANPFKTMEPNGEVGKELGKLPPGSQMWISEFNLTDQRYVVNGHWTHGLFEAALALNLLSDSLITRINQFRMSGDALHGDLFETAQGFLNGPSFKSLHPNITTNANEFTAIGNAMRLVGSTLHSATSISSLVFTPQNGAVISALSGGYSSLYGYKVIQPFANEMILLNLSDDSTLLHVNDVLDSSIVNYEILWWHTDTAARPFIEITGDMPIVSGTITDGQIYIPPYSVLRLYETRNAVYAMATDDTICAGSSTTILAEGATQYSWAPAVTTTGDQAVAYVAPSVTTTYTVTGTLGCAGADCIKLVTIHVAPKPSQGIISVTPSNYICPGTSVILSVQQTNANKFCWTSPDIGSQFMQSTVTVSPHDTTTYYLFGALNGCYSYRDSVTIFMRPFANAGIDEMSCINDSILIGAPAEPGLVYSWLPVTGLSDANTAQPECAPASTTSYIVTVTDPVAACSDQDTVIVEPLHCCQSSGPDPVFSSNTTSTEFLNTMLNVYGADVTLGTRTLNNYTGQIFINGSFIVDSSLNIYNCPRIKFGEKARIYVTAPDLKFKLKNDSLTTCGLPRWSGILNNNVLSQVIIDNCYVENADTFLTSMDDADYSLKNSYFHNNNCVLNMMRYIEELEGEVPEGNIYGCTFEGDTATSTGIITEHVNMVNIGQADEDANVFRNLKNGIIIKNGEAAIVNNYLNDLQYGISLTDTFSNPLLNPVYSVTIGGDADSLSNTFEQTNIAILDNNMSLVVKQDTFIDCNYAVWVKNCTGAGVDVLKNLMKDVFKGINLTGNKSTGYELMHNFISTMQSNAAYYPVGIDVADISNIPGENCTAKISANEIFNNGLYGIRLCNNNGYFYNSADNASPQVSQNIIHNSYSGFAWPPVAAIRLENCINNAIGENIINGTLDNTGHLQGINLLDVNGCELFCNTFDTLGAGIVFIGTNQNDSTWGNIFQMADTCVKVGQNTILYGKLNDQSGNSHFAPGNLFENAADLHLAKLSLPVITYSTGANELLPPTTFLNFNVVNDNLPVFVCSNTIGGDSVNQLQSDTCADSSPDHGLIQSIVQQYPLNSSALIDANEPLLWQTANQCPLECGADIFVARALLQTKYEGLIFNDDSLCMGIPLSGENQGSSTFSFSIYPNPALDFLRINYSFADEAERILEFSDVSGRIVAAYALNGKQQTEIINTSEMNSGYYLISLFNGGKRTHVQKLVIIK